MSTLILHLDENTVAKAQRAAAARHTTVEQLVHQFVENLSVADDASRQAATDELMQTLRDLSRPMGGKPWQQRDELYER